MNKYTENLTRDMIDEGLEIMSFEVLHIITFDGIAQRAYLLNEDDRDALMNLMEEEEMLARISGKKLEIHSYAGRLINQPPGAQISIS